MLRVSYRHLYLNMVLTGFFCLLFPERYLGDQRFSYDQHLSFTLRCGEEGARASVLDIIIEGGNGLRISAPIFAQVCFFLLLMFFMLFTLFATDAYFNIPIHFII